MFRPTWSARWDLIVRGFAVVWVLAYSAVAAYLLYSARAELLSPRSALQRYRSEPLAPRVFVRGTLRSATAVLPPLCVVSQEVYGSCGKSKCWRVHDAYTAPAAVLDVTWSSAPLPASIELSSVFVFDPTVPPSAEPPPERASVWLDIARRSGLAWQLRAGERRIVEACLPEGTPVFVEACRSAARDDALEPCAGAVACYVVARDPQSAVDAAADRVALRVAGAFFALLLALAAFFEGPTPLTAGLEDRAPTHRRKVRASGAILAVIPVAGLLTWLLRKADPLSTWAFGRDGFAAGASVLALWWLTALWLLVHRRRFLAALAPVLATPRSLLADAAGTVELAVRARMSNGGLTSFLDDAVVAFSELRIFEICREGKSTSTREILVHRPMSTLEVVDESSEGRLDLANSVLDGPVRTARYDDLPPELTARGVMVGERKPGHVFYKVEERVIRDGDPLYVFGDVSHIALSPSGAGYRSVRGSPTLGGTRAPVLVHAGDERGLVASLVGRARRAKIAAAGAAFACVTLCATLVYLALL